MKRLIFFFWCLAAALSVCAADLQYGSDRIPDHYADLTKAVEHAMMINRANDAHKSLWRPALKTVYKRKAYDDYWAFEYEESYSYYADGKRRSIIYPTQESVYFYDDKGRLDYIELVDSKTGLGIEKTVFTYDEIIENYIVRTEVISEGKTLNYSGVNIERDDNKNIIRIGRYNNYNGEYRERGTRYSFRYGDDNTADLIVMEDLDNYGNVESTDVISDIVWEKTNGQIYDVQIMSPTSSLLLGDNQIKSACVKKESWSAPIYISVEYKDNGRGYFCTHTQNGKRIKDINYEKLDDFGSYKIISSLYNDTDNGEVRVIIEEEEHIVNDSGFVLKDYLTHKSGEDVIDFSGSDGEVIYDPDYGFPVEYTLIPNIHGVYYGDARRECYSEYTDVSAAGVKDIIADDSDAQYYDINGMRVSKPSRGFYIVRKGNLTFKVFNR